MLLYQRVDAWVGQEGSVKNRFSDLTKVNKVEVQPGKDIMNRRQTKALREGCHEEIRLGRVFPQERR